MGVVSCECDLPFFCVNTKEKRKRKTDRRPDAYLFGFGVASVSVRCLGRALMLVCHALHCTLLYCCVCTAYNVVCFVLSRVRVRCTLKYVSRLFVCFPSPCMLDACACACYVRVCLPLMRCDAMRCDVMRCDAMRSDAMRCDAMRCDAMRWRWRCVFGAQKSMRAMVQSELSMLASLVGVVPHKAEDAFVISDLFPEAARTSHRWTDLCCAVLCCAAVLCSCLLSVCHCSFCRPPVIFLSLCVSLCVARTRGRVCDCTLIRLS